MYTKWKQNFFVHNHVNPKKYELFVHNHENEKVWIICTHRCKTCFVHTHVKWKTWIICTHSCNLKKKSKFCITYKTSRKVLYSCTAIDRPFGITNPTFYFIISYYQIIIPFGVQLKILQCKPYSLFLAGYHTFGIVWLKNL